MRIRNGTAIETVQLSIPQPSRLWEPVLTSLRLAIITGELSPGTHLVETQLVNKLKVSRGPIREALVHLEHEGFIVNYPHRGKFVADFSVDDIHEIYELRLLIEGYAAERTLEKLQPDHLHQLQALTDEMVRLAANHRFEEMAQADLEFHRLLVAMAGYKRLLHIWETLSIGSHALIAIVASSTPEIIQTTIAKGHQGLVIAIIARDLGAVKEALRFHLSSAERHILSMMHERDSG